MSTDESQLQVELDQETQEDETQEVDEGHADPHSGELPAGLEEIYSDLSVIKDKDQRLLYTFLISTLKRYKGEVETLNIKNSVFLILFVMIMMMLMMSLINLLAWFIFPTSFFDKAIWFTGLLFLVIAYYAKQSADEPEIKLNPSRSKLFLGRFESIGDTSNIYGFIAFLGILLGSQLSIVWLHSDHLGYGSNVSFIDSMIITIDHFLHGICFDAMEIYNVSLYGLHPRQSFMDQTMIFFYRLTCDLLAIAMIYNLYQQSKLKQLFSKISIDNTVETLETWMGLLNGKNSYWMSKFTEEIIFLTLTHDYIRGQWRSVENLSRSFHHLNVDNNVRELFVRQGKQLWKPRLGDVEEEEAQRDEGGLSLNDRSDHSDHSDHTGEAGDSVYGADELAELHARAEEGDVDAQLSLGLHYNQEGEHSEAFKYLLSAAQSDDATAQYFVADQYAEGEGVEADLTEAIMWFNRSAEQGDPDAQVKLAELYEAGEGVEKDLERAFKYYLEAAEQEQAYAQYSLYFCYRDGAGVEADLERALEYLSLAAEQDQSDAVYLLGLQYRDGTGGVTADEGRAFELFQRGANLDQTDASYELALCYEFGRGVEMNGELAFKHYMNAAQAGNADAQLALGHSYQNGDLVAMNSELAFEWYLKSARQENSDAQYCVAECYQHGDGVELNTAEAIGWYQRAADQGDLDSLFELGKVHQTGEGVKRNLDKAIELLTEAASQDHQESRELLESIQAERLEREAQLKKRSEAEKSSSAKRRITQRSVYEAIIEYGAFSNLKTLEVSERIAPLLGYESVEAAGYYPSGKRILTSICTNALNALRKEGVATKESYGRWSYHPNS